MKTTIIFVHTGNAYYLELALAQAKISNPNADIILLGDKSNNKYSYIKHYLISDYFESARDFGEVYFNYSPNKEEYELFCFQRWFVINDFLIKHKITDTVLYCDTDTLLFHDISQHSNLFSKYWATIEKDGTPCFVFINLSNIKKFCEIVKKLYSTDSGKAIIQKYISYLKSNNKKYGISDMTAWKYFQTLYPDNVIYIDKPILDSSNDVIFCYDHNINCEDGFMYKNGKKEIQIINNIPYGIYNDGKKVMFCGLHFQGQAKLIMPQYYCGKMSVFTSIYWRCLINIIKQKIKNNIKYFLK